MAELTHQHVMPAAPDAVWAVLADFGALHRWAENVGHSEIISARGADGSGVLPGTSRRVQVGRLALAETVTEAVPEAVLAYRIEGLPRALGRLSNRWTLAPAPSGPATMVTLTSSADCGSGPVGRLRARLGATLLARQSESMLRGLAAQVRSPS